MPNYCFIHPSMRPCGDMDRFDYHRRSELYQSEILAYFEEYDNMTAHADSLARTKSQDNLRRTLHLECTQARLEGKSVGEWRYFNGDMTVEEYNAQSICVCWDVCDCSKTCSRYPDLLCPCSDKIRILEPGTMEI